MKILETIEVSEAYKSLKETFFNKASRILIWIEIIKKEKGTKRMTLIVLEFL